MSAAATDAIARFALALDDRDWERVLAVLDDDVSRDYTSLFGTEPDVIAATDLVAEWEGLLSGLDAHQHLLGPAVLDVDGDEATAGVHVVGTHVLAGHPGSPWVVGGTYRFGLRRRDDGWRIHSIRLDTKWQSGDAAVLEEAAAQAS